MIDNLTEIARRNFDACIDRIRICDAKRLPEIFDVSSEKGLCNVFELYRIVFDLAGSYDILDEECERGLNDFFERWNDFYNAVKERKNEIDCTSIRDLEKSLRCHVLNALKGNPASEAKGVLARFETAIGDLAKAFKRGKNTANKPKNDRAERAEAIRRIKDCLKGQIVILLDVDDEKRGKMHREFNLKVISEATGVRPNTVGDIINGNKKRETADPQCQTLYHVCKEPYLFYEFKRCLACHGKATLMTPEKLATIGIAAIAQSKAK